MLKVRARNCCLQLTLGLICFYNKAMAQEDPVSSGPLTDSVGSMVQWFVSTLAILAVIFVLAYVLKRSRFVQKHSGQMTIVGQLSLGPKERLVQVSVEGQDILIGVTQGSISYICKLGSEEEQVGIEQKLAALVKDAVESALDKRLGQISSAPAFEELLQKAREENAKEQKEEREDKAIAAMKADDTPEVYDLSAGPQAPAAKPAPGKKAPKPYEFKPLPSIHAPKVEIPYEDLKPSQCFAPVDKDLMKTLEEQTMPKPEDLLDEEGNPKRRVSHYKKPFKTRHLIGNGFSGRGFI